MQNEIKGFIKYLKTNKNLSHSSLCSYERDIINFINFLKNKKINNILKVDSTLIENYILTLKEKGRANSTISRNIAVLKAFYIFLIINKKIKLNPVLSVKIPKVLKQLPCILTKKEVVELLEQPSKTTYKGQRDKAILELLYATGIRVSELINLKIENINLKSNNIICKGRNNIIREIPIGINAVNTLKVYFEKANLDIIKNKKDMLFKNIMGANISRQGIWKIVKEYSAKSNIEKEITPHTIRHSFAVHLLDNGTDMKLIQEMMGHKDISSTQLYTQLIDKKTNNIYNKTHPKA